MTTTKKLTIAVVALALSLVLVVGGTLAFLVAKSNTVTNTFTYGSIALTLTEKKGTVKDGDVHEFANIVPGATVEKDPTVTVTAKSENCYVYAKVTNNVVLERESTKSTVVTCNIESSNWTLVGQKTNEDGSVVSLYRYVKVVNKAEENQKLPEVFKTVKFSEDITSDDIVKLDAIEKDIVIEAYAHQSDNTDESTATEAAIEWAGVTAVTTTP